MRVHRYPRFYVQHDSVPLRTAKIVREIPFFHIKTLLNLVGVFTMVEVLLISFNNLHCYSEKKSY